VVIITNVSFTMFLHVVYVKILVAIKVQYLPWLLGRCGNDWMGAAQGAKTIEALLREQRQVLTRKDILFITVTIFLLFQSENFQPQQLPAELVCTLFIKGF